MNKAEERGDIRHTDIP